MDTNGNCSHPIRLTLRIHTLLESKTNEVVWNTVSAQILTLPANFVATSIGRSAIPSILLWPVCCPGEANRQHPPHCLVPQFQRPLTCLQSAPPLDLLQHSFSPSPRPFLSQLNPPQFTCFDFASSPGSFSLPVSFFSFSVDDHSKV
ncbi:unnamed protein product [Protopolystoma xenopodis]|uniref:Uncharacterized protein n=1 Tax=Protopolystoma xenopodis TaxID=117903 RepID=A0A448XM77_9PLAT|nr:unnamed protein product [Protopolystoma xenopodis]